MKKTGKQVLILLFICCWIFSSSVPVGAEGGVTQPENLYALSAVLMDGTSGRVLYEKNGYETHPMASTTKIMTCILLLEEGNLDDTAKTSSYAASMPKVHLGAREGEEFKVRDLLYSLMLESHNDSAVILAEYMSGSVQAFAEKMNKKAGEIGCKDTWFITPNGLDAQEEINGKVKIHATTAADLARIMRYCIMESPKREEFLNITQTPSYSFTDAAEQRNFSCVNHNAFLTMMEGAISGKTGFTTNAGYCYTGALESEGRTFIVALLGCGWPNNKSWKWSDTRKLMEYGMANYTMHSIKEAQIINLPSQISVLEGQSERIGEPVYVPAAVADTGDIQVLLKQGETVEAAYEGASVLKAPVKKGQKIGEAVYRVNGEIWKKEEVIVQETVEKIDFSWCLEKTMEQLAKGPDYIQ